MSNQLALPPEFADKVKAKISEAVLGLISDEHLTAMVNAEVEKFFKPDTTFFVERTKVMVPNTKYNPNGWIDDRKEFLEKDAVALTNKMSPFAVYIWTYLYEYAEKRLAEYLAENGNVLEEEFNKWFTENAAKAVDSTYDNRFAAMLHVAGGAMFAKTIGEAHFSAVEHIKNMLRTAGSPNGQHASTFLKIRDPLTGENVL